MIALANQGNEEIYEAPDHVLSIPQAPEMLLPILEVMPCSFSATTSPYAARGPTEEFGQVGDSRVIDKPDVTTLQLISMNKQARITTLARGVQNTNSRAISSVARRSHG